MKALLFCCAFALWTGKSFAEIAPDATGAPIFTVHTVKTMTAQPTTEASGQAQPQFDLSPKAVLTVKSLTDLKLGSDFKAIEVDLNAKDTQTLAKLTGKYKLLAFVGADGKTIVVSQITGPITDGALLFSDGHHSTPLALCIRQSFHLPPGTNQATVAPAQITPAAAKPTGT